MKGRLAGILLVLLLASTASAQQEPAPAPAVLTMWNRPIVTFRATVGRVTPEQRVDNARARINEHAGGSRAPAVTAHAATVDDLTGFLVTAGNDVVFGLVPADLDAESKLTLEQTATRAAEQLSAVLLAREEQRRPAVLARGIGLTLATLLAFTLAFRSIVAGRNFAVRKMDELLRGRQLAIAGIDISPTLATVERATFRVLSWAAIGAITYLALTFVFSLFPYTAPLGHKLGDYLVDTLTGAVSEVIRATPHLIAVVAVLLITRAIALWVSRLLAEVEHGARTIAWLAQEQARATRRLASSMIWILGLATAYSLLPWSGSRIFQGTSLVLGLGVSLASAGLVNQWISGIVILYSRSFRPGDYVKIGEVEGTVTELGPLATKIRTIRREEVTIPNAVVTAEKLTNFTRLGTEHGALLSIALSIGYDVPWQKVSALLEQAAANTAGVRSDPRPCVLQWELTDFYVEHRLHVHLERAEERITVRSALNSQILDTFAAARVQIMSPHFESQPERPVIASPMLS